MEMLVDIAIPFVFIVMKDSNSNGGCPGAEALEVRVRTSSIWRIAGG